ncbi:MAG: hypothetical protein K5696_11440 [Lachnospiraceae bacterium]|nr:hypothetical protein [Lachnospiraceae bacterium]
MKKTPKTILLLLLLLMLAGCGSAKPSELEVYREQMEHFYEEVATADRTIDAIDPDSEFAATQLLRALDRLDEACSEMADYNVPSAFSAMGDLPQETANYMSKAVDAYHDAYDGEFDDASESRAGQYYERANSCIRRMLSILHGDENKDESNGDSENSD